MFVTIQLALVEAGNMRAREGPEQNVGLLHAGINAPMNQALAADFDGLGHGGPGGIGAWV